MTTQQIATVDRAAWQRLAAAARAEHYAAEHSETRLLAAVDTLHRAGKLDADGWWQARLAVVAGVKR